MRALEVANAADGGGETAPTTKTGSSKAALLRIPPDALLQHFHYALCHGLLSLCTLPQTCSS